MPELPEVEAYKSVIESHCLKKTITDIVVTDKSVIKRPLADFKKQLIGKKFTAVKRMGKYLIISLSSSDKKVVMHFGMTGFVIFSKDVTEKVRFARVNFIFDKKAVLHWISVRKFEKIWLVDDITEIAGLKNMGPDALSISEKDFLALLEQESKKNIKAVLMDQSLIAGVGNEYADEILFQAGVDPHHAIRDLSPQKRVTIYKKIKSVLKYAIKIQHKNIVKRPESYIFSKEDRVQFESTYLQAHRHIDMICPKNKNHALKKATIAGRTTFYCPVDQK